MTSSKAGVGVLLPLLLSLLLLALSNSARAVNPAYPDLTYWEQWALDNSYTISNYVYSEGTTTGQDGTIGNEFICIKDDINQVIIGRPDVCGTYYSGLGYSFADITGDPTSLTQAPDIISNLLTDELADQNLNNWGGCYYSGQNLGGQHAVVPTSTANCGPDIINWSYNGGWVYRRHAIAQALKQAGVNVDGYQWEWRIRNNNAGSPQGGTDSLNVVMYIWDQSGNTVHYKNWSYNTRFDWTTFSGTELFTNPLVGQDLRDWQLQMYGRDTGNWYGYYGPEMNAPSIRMIYSSNPCAVDPLLHPDCDGYVDAYANWLYDQQCSANPLYDSGCPGYQQAYYDQQCSYNPLYDVGCPNYAQAYYDQQCSINPLYDIGCPGYEQAYYDQQCSINPLYDTGCSGYAQAYLDQQCGIDPLYDSTCNGYEQAYYDQQCSLDALYDNQCPGYAEAYAQEYLLNEETTSTETTVSLTQETITDVFDPEEIGMPSTTGDSTVDSILNDLSPSIDVAVVVAEPIADVAPEPSQETTETEATEETDSAGEMEELVADVETEAESSDESTTTEDTGGGDDESSDESEGETSDGGDSKSEKKDSKREKMKKEIAKKAAGLAEQMSNAASLEAQQAAQATVLALINYTPGFDTYKRAINGGYLPDATGYPDSTVPESRRGLRNGLAQQLLHEQMVEMQYAKPRGAERN